MSVLIVAIDTAAVGVALGGAVGTFLQAALFVDRLSLAAFRTPFQLDKKELDLVSNSSLQHELSFSIQGWLILSCFELLIHN